MALGGIARVYAGSFYELGKDKGNISERMNEFKIFSELFKSDEAFKSFMLSPVYSKGNKHKIIMDAFKGRISEYTFSFINIIIENGRLEYVVEIWNELYLIDVEAKNRDDIMNVFVTVAVALSTQLLAELKKVLSNYFKKEIIITEKVDSEIIGGVIIKAGDKLIDASLSSQLNKLQSNLLDIKVRSEFAYED